MSTGAFVVYIYCLRNPKLNALIFVSYCGISLLNPLPVIHLRHITIYIHTYIYIYIYILIDKIERKSN